MHAIIDVINFNADASCLSSQSWIEALTGGKNSLFYRWLSLYVLYNKKVALGLPCATIADILEFNLECIELINDNKHIFEIILRPYAHDVAILRTERGFLMNLQKGKTVLEKVFGGYTNFFLPPEFMLSGEQVRLLHKEDVQGTFILGSRFKEEIKTRLPKEPYQVKGLLGSSLNCIPFESELTKAYLHGIHNFNAQKWNYFLAHQNERPYSFSWRDGESSFFIPNTLEREEAWLRKESSQIHRFFLKEVLPNITFTPNEDLPNNAYHSYPLHSFSPWFKEFKMFSFIEKIRSLENHLESFDNEQIALWLQIINSDILSATEKDSPVITLKYAENVNAYFEFVIQRSERGYEGENLLKIFELWHTDEVQNYLERSDEAHLKKLKSRIKSIFEYCLV